VCKRCTIVVSRWCGDRRCISSKVADSEGVSVRDVERGAVRAGRCLIRSDLSCAGGRGTDDRHEAMKERR
jgi:hypothetical protein